MEIQFLIELLQMFYKNMLKVLGNMNGKIEEAMKDNIVRQELIFLFVQLCEQNMENIKNIIHH